MSSWSQEGVGACVYLMVPKDVVSDYFHSPTQGRLSIDEVFEDIIGFIKEDPDRTYNLIIGTDSQLKTKVCFVTAVIIYRQGKGGRFFYQRREERINRSLRQRIFYEASRSLEVASKLTMKMASRDDILANINVEIHLDIGRRGPTRQMIKEVVGMVVGSGYDARIKPDSFGASSVADKYTK